MPTFAIHYDYAADSDAARDEHRPAHREFLAGLQERGLILLRGPYSDDAPAGALLIGRADSAAELERALDDDPFWLHHLILRRTVREWAVLSPSVLD
ncbi:MAG: YciI family protein [Nakamurella sp.]